MAAGLLLCSATPSKAQLVISAQSVAASAGDTGASLDILLTNTGPTPTTAIGAFAFTISVAGSDITFTDITNGTTSAPYIFDGLGLFGPNILSSLAPQVATASDLFSVIGSGVTLGVGVTVGLGHLVFNVAGTASGPYPVTILPFPDTSLSDASFPVPNNVEVSGFQGGSIRVKGNGNQVPEPGTFALLGGLVVPATMLLHRRRA